MKLSRNFQANTLRKPHTPMLNLNRNNMNFFVYMEIGADLFSKIKWSVLVGLEGAWCQKISEGMELYRWEWVWRSIADQSQKQQSQSGNFVDYTIHYICELTKLQHLKEQVAQRSWKSQKKKQQLVGDLIQMYYEYLPEFPLEKLHWT